MRFGILKKLASLEDLVHSSPLSLPLPEGADEKCPADQCRDLLALLVGAGLLVKEDLPPRSFGSQSQLYECGKTKVYFSVGVLDLLEVCRDAILID
jgi:hypothetical protein